jgi:hypothetical protein
MLCAVGGESGLAISRAEAEMLVEIDTALEPAPARPAWTDLFAKVVANVLMSSAGYASPQRRVALGADRTSQRREPWPVATLSTLVALSVNSVKDAYRRQSLEERALSRLERQRIEIVTDEEMTETDGQWLAGRLLNPGHHSATEEAVLAYMRRENLFADPSSTAGSGRDGKAA